MPETKLTSPAYFRQLTPRGEGGISTFLMESKNNNHFIEKYFKPFNDKNPVIEIGRFCYGKLFDDKNELIDEVIISIIDENQIEIHSHGGKISSREIIQFLESIHFQQMPDSQFQQFNDSYHYHHSLKNISTINEYQFLKNQIKNFNHFKIQKKDLSDENIISILKDMVNTWQQEKNNRRRASICLAGIPNAGKSSLINAITGKKRSLVSSQAKTTRDTVTENFQTRGYLIKIIDTAGIHYPDNKLDEESIKQSMLHIDKTEIILWLHDCTLPFTVEEEQYIKGIRANNKAKPIWLILTKADIATPSFMPNEPNLFEEKWLISAQSGSGIEKLLDSLIQFLFPQAKKPLPLSAISEQMALEIDEFLQKVDLQPAKHKMLAEFFSKILNCIPNEVK